MRACVVYLKLRNRLSDLILAFTAAPLNVIFRTNSRAFKVSSSVSKVANQQSPISGRRLTKTGQPSVLKISCTFFGKMVACKR